MSRLAWALLTVLVLSNAVWFLAGGGEPGTGTAIEPRMPAADGPGDAPLPPLALRGAGRRAVAPPASARPRPTPTSARDADAQRRRWRESLQRDRLPDQRRPVVEEVRRALSSGDPGLTVAALRTVPWLGKEDVDREEMKQRVECFLIEGNPEIRRSAVVAFSTLGIGPGDLDKVLRLATDKDRNVRKEVPRAIAAARHGEIQGIAAEAFLHFLEDRDLSVRLQTLRTLHAAASIAPEVRDAVIALVESAEPAEARLAIYALAGTKIERDARTITALVAALEHDDPAFRAEARQGLVTGLPEAYGAQVSHVVSELLPTQPDLADRIGNVGILNRHGTEAQVEALARLADDENLPEVVRRSAREAIDSIRSH